MGVERPCFMKPTRWDEQLGLALPPDRAVCQNSQINNPQGMRRGWMQVTAPRISPRGGEKSLFLTSSFIGCVKSFFTLTFCYSSFRTQTSRAKCPTRGFTAALEMTPKVGEVKLLSGFDNWGWLRAV